jgi:hypothetical protein
VDSSLEWLDKRRRRHARSSCRHDERSVLLVCDGGGTDASRGGVFGGCGWRAYAKRELRPRKAFLVDCKLVISQVSGHHLGGGECIENASPFNEQHTPGRTALACFAISLRAFTRRPSP